MTGILEHEDAFHSYENAINDQSIALDLYQRFSNITRPYLENIIFEESKEIALRDWVSAANNMFENLFDYCIPKEAGKLSRKELRDAKLLLAESIASDIDNINEHELSLLVENTSRSVINSWLTDLNRNYETGMELNHIFSRHGSDYQFIENALIPFSMDNNRDIFVYSMNILADDLISSNEEIILPMNLHIIYFRDRYFLYRNSEIPNEMELSSNSPKDFSIPDIESFAFLLVNLWKNELANNFSPNADLNESLNTDFFSKVNSLACSKLGMPLKESELNDIFSIFTKAIKELNNRNYFAVNDNIEVLHNKNDSLLTRKAEVKENDRLLSDILLFRAMKQAFDIFFQSSKTAIA